MDFVSFYSISIHNIGQYDHDIRVKGMTYLKHGSSDLLNEANKELSVGYPRDLLLVGREKELAMLQESYFSALQGQAPLVLVEGEAGTGKTHLLRAFADWAEQQGARVLYAVYREAEVGIPYAIVLRILRILLRTLDPEEREEIAEILQAQPWHPILLRLMPEITDWLEIPPVQKWPKGFFTPGQVHEGVVQTVRVLTRHAPLVLIYDDLHWADTASLDMRIAVYRRVRSQPVLMIGSYRPEEVDQAHPLRRLRSTVLRLGRLRRVRLHPLEPAAIQQLVESLWPDTPFDISTWEGEPAREPAYWVALARLHANDGWPDFIPRSLREINELLISKLDPEAQRVLEAASVLGVEADIDLLSTITGLHPDRVELALHALTDQAIMTLHDGGYAIDDNPLARTIYESLDEEYRRDLHLRVGHALEAQYRDLPEAKAAMLARHFAAAEQAERTLRYRMMAGAWARRLFALEESRDLYWDALSQAVMIGDANAQTEIHEALGEICDELGDHRAALEHLHAALGGVSPGPREASIRVLIARSLSAMGEYEQARSALRQALSVLTEGQDPKMDGVIRLHLAWVEEHLEDRTSALSTASEALKSAIESQDSLLEADTAFLLAILHWRDGALEQARAMCKRSLEIRESMGDLAGCAVMWHYLGLIERDRRDLQMARHCFAMSADIFSRIGDPRAEALARAYWGEICASAHELAEAVEQFHRAFSLYRHFQGMEASLDLPLWTRPSFD